MFLGAESHNPKQCKKAEDKPSNWQEEMGTAIKKGQNNFSVYTQATPRVNKKVLLFDQENHKHLFPLVKDREIGIYSQYQNIVIKSFNDDDKQTSSTQLQRGMIQTIEDLYSVMGNSYTQ